jgi:outer membrane protein TolC
VLALLALAPIAAAQAPARENIPTVTLDDAIARALDADPAAVASAQSVASARSDVLLARGAWLPSLNLNSSYSNSSNKRFDQASGQLVSESYTAQLQASYDIFNGGRRWAQQGSSGAALRAADASFREQRFRTVLATKEAFYGAAAAQELLAAAEQRQGRARQQLEFAKTRLQVGSATRSDVLRAELELGNAELAAVDAESALRTARLLLARKIGVEGEVQPAAAQLPDNAPPLPSPEELAARAERSAPSVVATRAQLAQQKALVNSAFSAYAPVLRLSGGYDWVAPQFPPEKRDWNLRLTASLPLFNGFQREASVARARAQQRSAEARAKDAAIAVRADVENSAREIGSAERRVEIARRSVELAKEDLRVQEQRYRIGNATILDLQSSQLALTDAEIAYVRARQALAVSGARLEALLGEELL